jgi:hypothetical protein
MRWHRKSTQAVSSDLSALSQWTAHLVSQALSENQTPGEVEQTLTDTWACCLFTKHRNFTFQPKPMKIYSLKQNSSGLGKNVSPWG